MSATVLLYGLHMFKSLSLLALSVITFTSAAFADSTPSPRADMDKTINDIIAIVEANPGDAQKVARREKLRVLINPRFNFNEMSRRALGPNWNEITPQEQVDFTTLFSDLLAKTYLSKIETVKAGMVTVTNETIEMPKALVKTSVVSKGDTFPIDYKMIFQDGRWQVYDVVVENIGLVANYRNEFSGIMRKDKFSGLMSKLRHKAESE
jgi:phospholipid transport system substrate-binding protein